MKGVVILSSSLRFPLLNCQKSHTSPLRSSSLLRFALSLSLPPPPLTHSLHTHLHSGPLPSYASLSLSPPSHTLLTHTSPLWSSSLLRFSLSLFLSSPPLTHSLHTHHTYIYPIQQCTFSTLRICV